VHGSTYPLNPKNGDRLSRISQSVGNFFSGGSGNYSEDNHPKSNFAFNGNFHHISGRISEGIK
jgi:hypothetical protein